MFRKGGEVGGIMTGGMRENYANGTPSERIARVAAEYPSSAVDPLSQFLIQGGLKVCITTCIRQWYNCNAAAAFKQPTQNLFKNLSDKEKKKNIAFEGEI